MNNNCYRFFTFIFLIILLSSSMSFAKKIWVATDGDDESGDGSLGAPYQTIEFALETRSLSQIDTVFVRPGIYFENLFINSNPVVLMSEGGYQVTIINAASESSILQFASGVPSTTVLQGFTFRDAVESAIRIDGAKGLNSSPEIRNCRITGNDEFDGAGIYMSYSESQIHDCIIDSNTSFGSGAGIYSFNSSPRIWNNIIKDNVASGSTTFGGGIFIQGTLSNPALIQNNIFIGNSSEFYRGGGLYIWADNVYVLNNLFYNNKAAFGGGVFPQSGYSPKLYNNIFTENEGYAIYCTPDTANPIYFNNSFYDDSPVSVIAGCGVDSLDNFFDTPPGFVNADIGDFHLTASSALIDKGTSLPAFAVVIDKDGFPRTSYLLPDIGPYEYLDCNLSAGFEVGESGDCADAIVRFNNLSTGRWERAIWDYGNGDVDTFFVSGNPQTIYPSGGEYNVSLRISTDCATSAKNTIITIKSKPVAVFSPQPLSGCAPLTVNFTNNSIGDNSSYLWLFADLGVSVAKDTSFTFTDAGSYEVQLIASNLCGIDTTSTIINVSDLPTADFLSTAETEGTPSLLISFSDQSTNMPNEWFWEFGDDEISDLQNPTHIYTTPGLFNVSLTATNDCGDSEKTTRLNYVTIYGFELQITNTDTLDYREQIFTIDVTELFGPFDKKIVLTELVLESPSRGRIDISTSKDTVNANESFLLTAQLSADLPDESYTVRIIGKSISNVPADTLFIGLNNKPQTVIELSATALDYDTVQVDSVVTDTLILRNIAPFGADVEDLYFKVLNVVSSDTQFVPLVTSSGSTKIPAGGGIFEIPVEFKPVAIGVVNAELVITTDDPLFPIQVVTLRGEGIPERIPPFVESITPSNLATGVLIGQIIELTISELIDTLTVDELSLVVFSRRLQENYSGDISTTQQHQIHFSASEHFPPADTIEVTLSGLVRDLAGNTLDGNLNGSGEGSPLDDFKFTFFTGPAVYPGDCNNDGVVNELDILPIGVFFGIEGESRDLFGEGNLWGDKQALAWEDSRMTYVDADGNGVVNANDVAIIGINWAKTHNDPDPIFPVDFNYDEFNERFLKLLPMIENMAGTDLGDRMISLVTSVAGQATLPNRFTLFQNYPNPFNPTTRIDYALPEAMEVRLTVHNILGQTVRILVAEYQDAGYKHAYWDGKDDYNREVSSGVYFYRFESAEYIEIRKMLKLH